MSGLGRPWYDMQQRIHEWAEIEFGSATHVFPLFKRVTDEVDELKLELDLAGHGLMVNQVKNMPQFKVRIAKECADIVITLFRLCGSLGIDLMTAIDDKQTINEGRRRERNGDGTGKHIKHE